MSSPIGFVVLHVVKMSPDADILDSRRANANPARYALDVLLEDWRIKQTP
jgi:hypothetical protein